MSLQNPYCTLAQVQAETLNSSAADIPAFEAAINNASRFIDAETGRDFLYHDHRDEPWNVGPEYIGGHYLLIPWPCIKPSEVVVKVDGETLDSSEYRVVNDAQYGSCSIVRTRRWNVRATYEGPALGLRETDDRFVVVEVYGEFGYVEADTNAESTPSPALPGNISYACAMIAAVRSGKLKKEAIGLDGSRISLTAKGIPRDVTEILQRFRLRLSF